MFGYDNTARVKAGARANAAFAARLYEEGKGSEVQAYHVGQTVSGDGLGFATGVITDVYKEHGFYMYVITYKLSPRARKTYTKTLRQKDIQL